MACPSCGNVGSCGVTMACGVGGAVVVGRKTRLRPAKTTKSSSISSCLTTCAGSSGSEWGGVLRTVAKARCAFSLMRPRITCSEKRNVVQNEIITLGRTIHTRALLARRLVLEATSINEYALSSSMRASFASGERGLCVAMKAKTT